ncbi:double zinc ribbon [bacterium BMS3Abin03]|nr:double zinc ribbon [bacterium BMS3Abin03]
MKCNNCGAHNKDDNKFCVKCGAKLEKQQNLTSIFCPECGTENQLKNKFCISCGSELNIRQNQNIENKSADIHRKKQHKPHRQKRYAKGKNFSLIEDIKKHKVTSAVVIIIAGYLLFQFIPQEPKVNTNVSSRFQQTNIPVNRGNTKLNEIASKFVCSCGTCGELSLETCGCPTAEEEHALINTMLSQNLSVDEIVVAVANKYGWLKSEYYPQYKQIDKSKVWFGGTSQTLSNTKGNNLVSNGNVSNIATLADRYTIITQFECPCGQCDIKELSECNCTHPKGAIEVKGYIDQLIAENDLTASQIIEKVNTKYGGRKI